MLTSIDMRNVATFGENTVKINLQKITMLYGNNGCGKSTIAKFIEGALEKASECKLHFNPPDQYQIMVYNTGYVEKVFHSDLHFQGIFTLGEDSKDALILIQSETDKLKNLDSKRIEKIKSIENLNKKIDLDRKAAKDAVWSIKETYKGGPFEFCIEGSMSKKDVLWSRLQNSSIYPEDLDISELAKQAESINTPSSERPKLPLLPPPPPLNENLLSKAIVGSTSSYLSPLIKNLNNSDWVKNGKKYLEVNPGHCPFCQQSIDERFIENLNKIFDQSYNDAISELNSLKTSYRRISENYLSALSSPSYDVDYVKNNTEFAQLSSSLAELIKNNLNTIERKIETPSALLSLGDISGIIKSLNNTLKRIQQDIDAHNQIIRDRKTSSEKIKTKFWQYLRRVHKLVFDNLQSSEDKFSKDHETLQRELSLINNDIQTSNDIIKENQEKITGIDLSIDRINKALDTIGVTSFHLVKSGQKDGHYELRRSNGELSPYKSLSEGEKTLISFLYFMELCKGSSSRENQINTSKRIVVMDDPISSLSHNYVYEIASLIYNEFINKSPYCQTIILTHSLFFFQEIIKQDEKSNKPIHLLRVSKGVSSSVTQITKKEILNEYQSFWRALKDIQSNETPPILIANIMRNILEQYFSFTLNRDGLYSALKTLESEPGEFKPFFRYINRQSHSDSINLTDMGQIPPQRYLDKFKEIFQKLDQAEYYNKMMGLSTQ